MTPSVPTRILLIMDYMGPGDALRISSCLRAVREEYASAEIVLLAHEAVYPLFARSPLFDRVVASRLYKPTDSSLPRWLLWLIKGRELARLGVEVGGGYDLVIAFSWGTTALNLLGRLVGRQNIGYSNRLPWLLSTQLGRFKTRNDEVGQNQALLSEAGIASVSNPTPIRIHDEQDEAVVERLLSERGGDFNRLAVLHPGSDWACQQWLPERWAALADQLVTDYAADIVFTGLNRERSYIDAIRARMRQSSTSLAGCTSLRELGALLSRARLCVCVDSVVYELTQAADTPAVVLAGPTTPQDTWPGHHPPIIVNRTPLALRRAINDCWEPKAAYERLCLNYACPMAGLRHIQTADVLHAVATQRAFDNEALN